MQGVDDMFLYLKEILLGLTIQDFLLCIGTDLRGRAIMIRPVLNSKSLYGPLEDPVSEYRSSHTTTPKRTSFCLLSNRAKVYIPIRIVPPPLWEQHRRTTSTKDCKRQDEQCRQTSSIPSTRDKIGVVFKDAWSIVTEVKLCEETGNDLTENNAGLGCIVGDVAGILDKLREIDLGDWEVADLWDKLRRFFMSMLKR